MVPASRTRAQEATGRTPEPNPPAPTPTWSGLLASTIGDGGECRTAAALVGIDRWWPGGRTLPGLERLRSPPRHPSTLGPRALSDKLRSWTLRTSFPHPPTHPAPQRASGRSCLPQNLQPTASWDLPPMHPLKRRRKEGSGKRSGTIPGPGLDASSAIFRGRADEGDGSRQQTPCPAAGLQWAVEPAYTRESPNGGGTTRDGDRTALAAATAAAAGSAATTALDARERPSPESLPPPPPHPFCSFDAGVRSETHARAAYVHRGALPQTSEENPGPSGRGRNGQSEHCPCAFMKSVKNDGDKKRTGRLSRGRRRTSLQPFFKGSSGITTMINFVTRARGLLLAPVVPGV